MSRTPKDVVADISALFKTAEDALDAASDAMRAMAPLIVEGTALGIVKPLRGAVLKSRAVACAGAIDMDKSSMLMFHEELYLIAKGDNELGEDIDVPPMDQGGIASRGDGGR